MAKFYGVIGYGESEEVAPGVWKERTTERYYFGDVLKNRRHLQSSDHLNDDVNVSNEISIIADPFAYKNFHSIRYVVFMGTKWKVSDIEVQHPRLVLMLGGVYHG